MLRVLEDSGRTASYEDLRAAWEAYSECTSDFWRDTDTKFDFELLEILLRYLEPIGSSGNSASGV